MANENIGSETLEVSQAGMIKKRISSRLAVHARPRDKYFWHGFLVAAVDLHAITHEEYVPLRNMVTRW